MIDSRLVLRDLLDLHAARRGGDDHHPLATSGRARSRDRSRAAIRPPPRHRGDRPACRPAHEAVRDGGSRRDGARRRLDRDRPRRADGAARPAGARPLGRVHHSPRGLGQQHVRVPRRPSRRAAQARPDDLAGKTWEGFIGGTAATVFVTFVALYQDRDEFFSIGQALLLGLALAAAAPLGDLFESLLKRRHGRQGQRPHARRATAASSTAWTHSSSPPSRASTSSSPSTRCEAGSPSSAPRARSAARRSRSSRRIPGSSSPPPPPARLRSTPPPRGGRRPPAEPICWYTRPPLAVIDQDRGQGDRPLDGCGGRPGSGGGRRPPPGSDPHQLAIQP